MEEYKCICDNYENWNIIILFANLLKYIFEEKKPLEICAVYFKIVSKLY